MKKRILLINLSITLAALLMYSIISTSIFYQSSIDTSKENIKLLLSQYYNTEVQFDNDGALKFSRQLGNARITFISGDGVIVGDSHHNYASMDNHLDRPEVQLALTEGSGYDIRNSATTGQDMLYYCEMQSNNSFVRISVATKTISSIYVHALPALLSIILLDICLCLIFAMALTKYILKPVHDLTIKASRNDYFTTDNELKPLAKKMKDMNKSIQEQLLQLQQEKQTIEDVQQSKQEFISNVSHEMLTPLTSIKGYAEWLVSGKLDQEQTANSCQIIAKQADRLANLITCIVNYNQIDNDNMELYEVNISKVTEELLTTLYPSILEQKITLNVDIDEDVIIKSRQERVSQIIGNLVRNAIKYNKENGSLTVSIKRGEKVTITIADTGVGIAPKYLDKVFSRFFTVDKSHSGKNGGFGLGLAVCKKICHNQGWDISVDSKLGEGTTFTVVI